MKTEIDKLQSRPALAAVMGLMVAAFVSPAQAAMVHQYNFSGGTLADSAGSIPLQNNYGGTVNVGSFSFGANQGPTLAVEPGLSGNYSIGLQFSLADLNGWRSIINFSDLQFDRGNQYLYFGNPNFYPVNDGPSTFHPNTLADLLVTRDGTSGQYAYYLNGVLQNTFMDSTPYAKGRIVGGSAIFQLFQDDNHAGEASAGRVDLIRVWDTALTGAQVGSAFTPVPEPSTYIAGALLLLPFGASTLRFMRRNRKS